MRHAHNRINVGWEQERERWRKTVCIFLRVNWSWIILWLSVSAAAVWFVASAVQTEAQQNCGWWQLAPRETRLPLLTCRCPHWRTYRFWSRWSVLSSRAVWAVLWRSFDVPQPHRHTYIIHSERSRGGVAHWRSALSVFWHCQTRVRVPPVTNTVCAYIYGCSVHSTIYTIVYTVYTIVCCLCMLYILCMYIYFFVYIFSILVDKRVLNRSRHDEHLCVVRCVPIPAGEQTFKLERQTAIRFA